MVINQQMKSPNHAEQTNVGSLEQRAVTKTLVSVIKLTWRVLNTRHNFQTYEIYTFKIHSHH